MKTLSSDSSPTRGILSRWIGFRAALTLLPALLYPIIIFAQDASGPRADGIDVSHHNNAIDWQAVKAAGFSFAYIKATEGVDSLDSRFAEHWQNTANVGLPRGAYHFYVTEDDPNEQADFFLSTVPADDPGDLIPVVDVEIIGRGTASGWVDDLQIFLDRVEARFGTKPMIYTSPNFWNAHVDADFGDYPLWIAEYGVDAPSLPQDWKAWSLWQWAEDQTVAGVEKGVDVNTLPSGSSLDTLRLTGSEPADSDP